ncbi:MAG: TolC family protein [Pyrinomonadaceae bacterium]|nr:TolC family protein [Phycisphaerales bacterium]
MTPLRRATLSLGTVRFASIASAPAGRPWHLLGLAGSSTGIARFAAMALACAAMLPGCASPLRDDPSDELRHSILQSATREIRQAQSFPEAIALTRENPTAELKINEKFLEEDEKLGGPKADLRAILKKSLEKDPNRQIPEAMPLALGLNGRPPRTVLITLEHAVRQGVEHNLNIQFARRAPAVMEAQVVAAQAAFDWLFFHNFQWNSTDEPRVRSNGSLDSDQRQVTDFTTGIRKRLFSGGQFTVQHEFRYTDVRQIANSLTTSPNPAYESNIVLQLDQPLLRNFGSDVALAQVRINKNQERDEIQSLKTALIQNIGDMEEAYWSLVRAQEDLKIVQRLFVRGVEVRNIIEERLKVDAKPVQFTDAQARADSRLSNVIRAQNAVAQASDRLKLLMNDPDITVASDVQLLSADSPLDQAILFSVLDAIETSMANRPEVQRALLSIDNTSIRRQVAANGLLPRLDLRLQTQFSGLGNSTGGSFDDLYKGNHTDFLLGLNFEQPIGNREAEATFRQRKLETSQAVIAYRNTIQGIVSELIVALRNVSSNYTLIAQTRSARLAASESLRALEVEEDLTQPKTAEFLNIKLQRQEQLADAEQQEIQALTEYNISLARLHSAMGTSLKRNKIMFDVENVETIDTNTPVFPKWSEER